MPPSAGYRPIRNVTTKRYHDLYHKSIIRAGIQVLSYHASGPDFALSLERLFGAFFFLMLLTIFLLLYVTKTESDLKLQEYLSLETVIHNL